MACVSVWFRIKIFTESLLERGDAMPSKILYLMHVPWGWIEQRPHIFAKKLGEDYEVCVACWRSLVRYLLRQDKLNPPAALHPRSLWRLPSLLEGGVLSALFTRHVRRKISDIDEYECIWVTYPTMIDLIPEDYAGIIIYDCMDDHAAMVEADKRREVILAEERLLKRADAVIVSSDYLKAVKGREDALTIRNGYKEGTVYPICPAEVKEKYVLGYFGTVDKWMDFDLLNKTVERFDNLSFKIIGPRVDGRGINHAVFTGPVCHEDLYDSIEECDCLIMPFVVNEVIKAVDPVKLYEYIAFGKCVVACWYPEIDRFSDYVYFYHSEDEFHRLMDELTNTGFPVKYSEKQRDEFLATNSWEERYRSVVQLLKSVGV